MARKGLYPALGLVLLLLEALATPSAAAPLRSIRLYNGGHFVVADHPDLTPDWEFSIEAWVWRDTATGYQTIVGKDAQTSYWLGITPEGKIRFQNRGRGTHVDGAGTIPLHRWTHICVSYDRSSVRRYYINGVLDTESHLYPGQAGRSTAPLRIGADESGMPFTGLIDGVRIWNRGLQESTVRQHLNPESFYSYGLLAGWDCDYDSGGVLWDSSYHLWRGTAVPPFEFHPHFASFLNLWIPMTARSIAVDGIFDGREYEAAERVVLDHGYFPPVYAVHDDDDLYISMPKIPRGARPLPQAMVLLDTRYFPHDDFPGPTTYRFSVRFDGQAVAARANALSKFEVLTLPAGSFQAAVSASEFDWSAELRIRRTAFGHTEEWDQIRVAFLASGIDSSTDGYFWPPLAESRRPRTWARVGFTSAPSSSTHLLSGTVVDELGRGMPGASLDLFTSHSGLLTHVTSATSAADGGYRLTFTGQPPDAFLIQERDPPGVYSLGADAGADGTTMNLNSLRYPARPSTTTYSSGTFTEAIGLPPGDFLDRHLLIVHSSVISRGDLAPFVDWKRRLGFQVETRAVEEIALSSPGQDLAEKIRNWLRARWQNLRPHAVYAILIGRGDVIPVRDIAWFYADLDEYSTPGSPKYHPRVPTDWYYADLDSDWDPDGDSLFGEGLGCASQDPPCWDRPDLVELPRGISASEDDDWESEISVARLGVNLPAEVRSALGAAMAAEMSGSPVKRRALLAGSFWGFEGRSWDDDPAPGRYFQPGDPRGDGDFLSGWICCVWDGVKPLGHDTAEHLEPVLRPILEPHFDEIVRLYEATSPGGSVALIPTRQPFDLPLEFDTLNEIWTGEGFGLVNLEGHGDPNGVYQASWVEDWNSNGRIDSPANPSETGGDCASSCGELRQAAFMRREVDAPLEVPPVVFANACGTGAISWASDGRDEDGNVRNLRYGPEAIAGHVPGAGKAAAWIGSLAVFPVGRMDGFQDDFNRDLVTVPLSIGDAFWKSMADLARANTRFDWRLFTPDLFGDPSASYWGNPADMRSPWPQSGRDWRATCSTPLAGPRTGGLLWVTQESNILAPPVVEASGTIVVGRASGFARFRSDGVLAASFGAPTSYPHQLALTTDGIYGVTGSALEDYDAAGAERFQTVIGSATGPVRVGPDGIVWVPTLNGMARGVGGRFEILAGGAPSGPAAFTPEGYAVWSAGSRLWYHELDRRGSVRVHSNTYTANLTPPAVGPDGRVFMGRENTFLYGVLREDGSGWRYDTEGQVASRPAVAGSGVTYRVYAATVDGTVHCVSRDGERVWARPLGYGIDAPLTADGSRLYAAAGGFLFALELSTGALEWQVDLGGPTGPMSSPVVAMGRVIYVLRADGRLAAVGEDRWHLVPEAVAAVARAGGVFEVSWRDRSAGETGFLVESCSPDGTCTMEGQAAAGQQSFMIQGILPGQSVYFRVRTLDGDGGGAAVEGSASGDFSYSSLVTALPGLPPAPVLPTASAAAAESILVSWQYAGDRDMLLGFEVRRRKAGSAEEILAGEVGPAASGFLDGGLEPGTQYSYRILAFNAAGSSAASPPVTSRTKSITLASPANFTATYADGVIHLSWRDMAAGETGYVIERRIEGAASHEPIAVLPAGAQGFPDQEGLATAEYEYRVKAVAALVESPYAYATVFAGAVDDPPGAAFRRGDANSDKAMDISDALTTLNYLFLGTAIAPCPDAMDANDDGALDIADGIHTLAYLFSGGAGPPAPGPSSCGSDPTGDALPECRYPCP